MKNERNFVGHCFNQSLNNDKIYIVSIKEENNVWSVVAKWGRRGSALRGQIKESFLAISPAKKVMEKMVLELLEKNYVDITSPEYSTIMKNHQEAQVRMTSRGIFEHLEYGSLERPLVENSSALCEICCKKFNPLNDRGSVLQNIGDVLVCPECSSRAKKVVKRDHFVEQVLICINNTGIEDKFDIGIEYLVEDHPDSSMVYVYDKMGSKGECFKNRFMTEEQWKRKNGYPVSSDVAESGKDSYDISLNVVKNRDQEKINMQFLKNNKTGWEKILED